MTKGLVARIVFKQLLVRAIVVPAVVSVLFCAVLVWQVVILLDDAALVEHTNLVIADANRLEKLHIDLETGLRGYLIRGDSFFLEPYERALATIGTESAELRQMVADRPVQQTRITEIDAFRGQWLVHARMLIKAYDDHEDWRSKVASGTGKKMMDEIRAQFTEFIRVEEGLRTVRSAKAQRSARIAVGVAIGVALSLGGLLALLSTRQLRFLNKNYEAALARAAALNAVLEQRVAERTHELAASNTALGEANKELEAFAYSVSHDLRAPLRHIAGFSDLLKKSLGAELKRDDAENLAVIQDTAHLAGRMVDDLLGFSRVGRTQLAREAVDMDALVEQCRAEMEPDLRDRLIRWRVSALPAARGDRGMLKLALQNLLANAVKYTAKRHVAQIDVGGRTEDGGATYWVRDNGVGFDMAYVDKLFGVFQRLHRAEEFEGTGIGLANVRRIVLRHHGRVWAEGVADRGAVFYFWLPFDEKIPLTPASP